MASSSARRVRRGLLIALGLVALLPASASAHQLTGRYESPLPLAAYLAGAAIAVGLSFAIVLLRPVNMAAGAPVPRAAVAPEAPVSSRGTLVVPRWFRLVLKAVGMIAWLWIVAQAIVGG